MNYPIFDCFNHYGFITPYLFRFIQVYHWQLRTDDLRRHLEGVGESLIRFLFQVGYEGGQDVESGQQHVVLEEGAFYKEVGGAMVLKVCDEIH